MGTPVGRSVASQTGWRSIRLGKASPLELELWDAVLQSERVAIGKTAHGTGHLHAALRAGTNEALVLDNWLIARDMLWTQRWQNVFNRALFDRAALMRRPVQVMSGGHYLLGEVAAAEAGATSSRIRNVPYWP